MGRKRTGVSARSKRSIEITFNYKGKRCRETLALKPTPTNLTRAERHRAAIILAIENGTFDYATTFPDSPRAAHFASIQGDALLTKQYLENWLVRQEKHLRSSTLEGYEKIVNNRLIPHFGDVTLSSIKRRDVREWLDSMGCANKTMANIQSVLRKALADAVEDELISENPLAKWTYRRLENNHKHNTVDPFTPEEQIAILKKCTPMMANQVQFCFWTGVRTSELVALEWDDIDFRRGVIIVDKAITQAARGRAEGTKTRSGTREIKMLNPARAALKAQKKYTGTLGGSVFVHPIKRSRWAGDQEIRKYWISLLKRAEVRYRRPYQTRHTYASMMLSAGEHPMWVAEQMGHSDWSMIIRVYGKWMPAADTKAGSRAEDKFADIAAQKVVAKTVATQS